MNLKAVDLEKAALALGLSLACIPSFALVSAQILLLLGGDMSGFGGVLVGAAALFGGGWIAFRFGGAASIAGVAAVIAVALIANHIVIDTSYDGQGYHFDAIESLHEGWNPFYEPYAMPRALRGVSEPLLWQQHYPQGAWLMAAAFRALGASVEAAKILNFILASALFFAVFALARAMRLKRRFALILAAVAAANPVILSQLFSRMNDGALGACFALTAIFALLWLRERDKVFLLAAAAIMIFGLNLKFSAPPLFATLCAGLTLLAWILAGKGAALRFSGAMLAAGVAGLVIFGAHPYVTNFVHNGHPLYPLMGQGAVDIMTGNRPEGFNAISPAQRLFTSYFSPTSNSYDGVHGVKAPFTLRRSELRAAGEFDPRLAGFGPLFSGAGLLAAGLSAWLLLRRDRRRPETLLVASALALAVAALLMPESWWARYVPQLWWAPLLVVAAAWFSQGVKTRVAGWALLGVLALNGVVGLGSAALNAGGRSLSVYKQVRDIAAASPVKVYLGVSDARVALLPASAILSAVPLDQSCAATPLAASFPLGPGGAGYCATQPSPH